MTGAEVGIERHAMGSGVGAMSSHGHGPPVPSVLVMTLLSFTALALGVVFSEFAAPMMPM